MEEDLDSLFRGMASTVAEKEDSVLVSDVTGNKYRSGVESTSSLNHIDCRQPLCKILTTSSLNHND